MLREAARGVLERAHAPYSDVRVGAALLAEDGRVFTGCNVENASFGLTICAERNAVARAIADGATRFRAIWIEANRPGGLAPCGACRQVLHEFAPDLWVALPRGADATLARLSDYLPDAFGPGDLAR